MTHDILKDYSDLCFQYGQACGVIKMALMYLEMNHPEDAKRVLTEGMVELERRRREVPQE